MNEEIDESEFYHQDFTTASDWELFIARLEEIIHDWSNEDVKSNAEVLQPSPQGVWSVKSDRIYFVDTEFTFSYYKNTSILDKQGDEEGNFKIKHPLHSEHNFILDDGVELNAEFCIPIWYGLNRFMLLSSVKNEGITSESKIKILLSSLNIAIGNTSCSTPLFVQIREKWQKCYLGVCEVDNIRTNFDMIHLQKGPQHCQYLTGLLDLFKTKVMSPISLDPVVISVQFTYTLNEFGNVTWRYKVLDYESENYENGLCALPFGVSYEPISAMQIKCSWLNLQEHLVVDSENYTDFDPLQAQKWSLLSLFSEPPVCLLSECLSDFLSLINSSATVCDTLGDFITSSTTESSNPLDLLTEPKVPTISTVLKRAARNSLTSARSKSSAAPLAEEVLVPLLYYLFPDAEEVSTFPYTEQSVKLNETSTIENLSKGFKTCNSDSLVTRLAIVLAQAQNTLGGPRSLAQLWFEFYQEMRYRWEKSVIIPG
ncbi:rab3 GTPase-activating protein catalytic subunit-like [Agrilus planipennis]|uniref:Rab3 GTPase-activating protein catalytic subunit-like n=1 Tax=Agrilus planipennis TaxID=224129 RepID=A0A1W4XJK2_AGRPL|nr:rab3 GTPase-activating protein catalytic subunit-like [Agrilus planipennis]